MLAHGDTLALARAIIDVNSGLLRSKVERMRIDYAWILLALAACASSATPAVKAPLARDPAVGAAAAIEHASDARRAQPGPAESPAQTLAADTPMAALAAKLAPKYTSAALGGIAVSQKDGRWSFDFGEYASEVASRTNPDGSVSFITIAPGALGLEFVVGEQGGKPTLTLRDGQHEYVFTPVG